jgi:hypothetical protein
VVLSRLKAVKLEEQGITLFFHVLLAIGQKREKAIEVCIFHHLYG